MRRKIEQRILFIGDLNEIEDRKKGLLKEDEKRLFAVENNNTGKSDKNGDQNGINVKVE
jgi:hypothetical protein